MKFQLLISFISLFVATSNGSRILGVFPTPWTSHWKVGSSVVQQLAKAGHDITFVSRFELKTVKIRNVILTDYPEDNKNMFSVENLSAIENFVILPEVMEMFIDFALSHTNVRPLMNEKFDAVIVEVFHSESLLGLGAHFKCPVIGVTTFGTSIYTDIMTGSSSPPSYVPSVFHHYTDKMNFGQRFYNTIIWKLDELYLNWLHFPKQRKLYEKHFPTVERTFDEQRKSIAVLLNNNHFASSTIKPTMPNIIDIGGIHVDEAKPLPSDIQDFLDSAVDGAIVFSMGSIIKAIDWPEEKREAFIAAFGKLKQKVLWKYENETLLNKPDNVMISSWIPQRDILAHPNVKLFITHGGLLGTTEALVEGIPVLGIPIFGDQKMNMNIAVGKGYAVQISFNEISEESLSLALSKALTDQILFKAKEASRIYTDRSLSPQKAAVYWVEYAIRHKGAPHLRAASLELNYFEAHSIDVYFTLFVFATFILAAFTLGLKFILKSIEKSKTTKHKIN